jgi:3'5'-cyclic nucleotide phosphodiesterase
MCTSKFMKRIVSPDIADDGDVASKLHDYTHGISDPLTLLAICFSALIHDVDHRGVGNAQLMKEDPNMGDKYRGKSVAEQNSLDLSWDLLVSCRRIRAPTIFAQGPQIVSN